MADELPSDAAASAEGIDMNDPTLSDAEAVAANLKKSEAAAKAAAGKSKKG